LIIIVNTTAEKSAVTISKPTRFNSLRNLIKSCI